ncbi:protein rep [Desulfovibrio aerotolerans]|uniref:Protein rep n=1 Tax=Solidesulfovibrio aerotolerans TaxID=295255 RepID=A0A7C9MLR9_9BACT|nr:protein rep [Solidesulfovibrio aerotolerans]MYL85369.1 protein rep [Solidesulfovibrio aerotolerans]
MDFVSSGAALAGPLGKEGVLPPRQGWREDTPAEKADQEKKTRAAVRRGRFLAVKAERVRQTVQDFQTSGVLPTPSKSCWCCGHGIIPGENKTGTPTGAPGFAQIHQYVDKEKEGIEAEGSHYAIAGVVKCGSPFVCPVCSRRINAQRREDIVFITSKMLELKYSYAFATFTASHKYTDSLYDFIERFQEAQRKLKQGKAYRAFRDKWHLKHSIRTAEVTLDHPDSKKKSGWHWHSHVIMFLRRPLLSQVEAEQMQAELSTLWTKACARFGLVADAKHGLDIERPHFKSKNGVVYLDEKNAIKLADYAAKKVSFEASPSPNVKLGRKSDRITSFELIGMVTLGKRHDLMPKLAEFMTAIKGRRSIYLSRGLADLVGLNEQEDAEVVEGKIGAVVYTFDDDEWSKFSRRGKTRAAMHRLDDGLPVEEVVEAYIEGFVSVQQLERIGTEDTKDAALQVWDERTGEALVTEEDIERHFAGDCPPILEVLPVDLAKKNQAPAPARPAGRRSAA